MKFGLQTQNPQEVQKTVGEALGLKREDIRCHVTLLGGGFGRKSKPDYVVEAALLSKKVGKPVKISWTREEDLRFDYYHTTSAMYFKAALDDQASLRRGCSGRCSRPSARLSTTKVTYAETGDLTQGFTDMPFDVPHVRAENGPAEPHLRIGWLRSVANVYHAFGVQSFIDECAHAAGEDPAEYWLKSLGAPRHIDFKAQNAEYDNYGKPLDQFPVDTGKLRRVAELALERSGWANKKSGSGRGWGFAAHRSFLTYVAAVVEVEVDAQGKSPHSARRYGDRLRPCGSSGWRAGAVRRRVGLRRERSL